MPLIRKSSSVTTIVTQRSVLSRRSTSIVSNGDVPDLKRRSSSLKTLDGAPDLKRKRSIEKETTVAKLPLLSRKSSSVGSKISKASSILRKGSSLKLPAKRVRKPKQIFEIVYTPIARKKTTKEKALLYLNGEYLALRTDDGKYSL